MNEIGNHWIVRPIPRGKSPENMRRNRLNLFHALNPISNKTFCGRKTSMWEKPFDTLEAGKPNTTPIDDPFFCKHCRRVIEEGTAHD